MWQAVFNVTEMALVALLKFFKYPFKMISLMYRASQITLLSDQIPCMVKRAEKLLKINERKIINYIVCPKCHSIYKYEDCVIKRANGMVEAKLCRYVKYPDHPHQSKREACKSSLFKNTKSVTKKRLPAIKVYPYLPLQHSM